jgi:glycosyltransferase involved in cell wall biosynthesis
MRLLVVTAWDGASGVLTVVRTLATQLKSRGVHFSAFSFNAWDPNSPWKSICENLFDPRSIKLTELLLRDHFDVVHLIDTACAPGFSPARYLSRASYSGGVLCMSQNATDAIVTPPGADVYIACSEASRSVMARTVPDPIRVIPNAVDLNVFRPMEPSVVPTRPLIAWVGRTGDLEQKDLAGFLQLAARHWDDEFEFLVIEADREANSRVCEWLAGRVRYLPRQPIADLVNIYAQVRASGGAVVSTSRFEGMSLALLEAAACCCAVVAPHVLGTEHLVDGETAYLYRREDGIEGLSQCLRRLRMQEERLRITDSALESVRKNHDACEMAERYFEAYRECVAKAGRRAKRPSFFPMTWKALYAGRRLLRRHGMARSL